MNRSLCIRQRHTALCRHSFLLASARVLSEKRNLRRSSRDRRTYAESEGGEAAGMCDVRHPSVRFAVCALENVPHARSDQLKFSLSLSFKKQHHDPIAQRVNNGRINVHTAIHRTIARSSPPRPLSCPAFPGSGSRGPATKRNREKCVTLAIPRVARSTDGPRVSARAGENA